MTTFFSVDVETTSTELGRGQLLTIGVQCVRFEGGMAKLMPTAWFYERLDVRDLDPAWVDTPTGQWWAEQNEEARREAFQDPDLTRVKPEVAADRLLRFATTVERDASQRVFVANPVSFDKPWVDQLFTVTFTPNPFHYQSLCLRSMKFGLRRGSTWSATRDNHEPEVPHHAFYDAQAQALDLIAMLQERDA